MMLLLFHKIFPSERSWWIAAKRCIINDMQKMILDKAVDIEGRRLDSRRSISDVLCSMISPHRRYQLTLILNSQNVEFNIEIFWRKGFHCYFQASPNHHGWVAPFLSDPLGRQQRLHWLWVRQHHTKVATESCLPTSKQLFLVWLNQCCKYI